MGQLRSYYRYWRNRVDEHGIHSPFVFDFYNSVVLKTDDVQDEAIRRLASRLRHDSRRIAVKDFGAGSKKFKGENRSVASIAKNSAISAKYGRLLLRLVERYQLKSAIELGTSLGIGSLYITQNQVMKKLVTIEGAPTIAEIAAGNFSNLGVNNIELLVGEFDEHLMNAIRFVPKPELVFIDGNHRYDATMKYFNFFMQHIPDHAFIIFDDIYWSAEMEKAWKEICSSPEINVSMDLFRIGIVCKRPGQAKQHFVLKY